MKVMPRIVGIFAIVGGVIMIIAGVITYIAVTEELKDEKIVVSDDADNFAGEPVDGPFTAYAEAEVIQKHALEASGGKTYAELDRDDPTRATVQSASFLRASLFTSVVAFGVAALVVGLGILFILVGLAVLALDGKVKRLALAGSGPVVASPGEPNATTLAPPPPPPAPEPVPEPVLQPTPQGAAEPFPEPPPVTSDPTRPPATSPRPEDGV
jgi:hypothetical protein